MKKLCLVLALLVAVAAVQAASMEMTSARLYKKQGELEKALQYYDAELQKNPNNGEALFERGELLGEIAMAPGKAELAKQLAGDAANPQRALLEHMLSDFEKVKANAEEKTRKKILKEMDRITGEAWTKSYLTAVHEDSSYKKAVDSGTSSDSAASFLSRGLEQLDLAILIAPERWESYVLKAHMLDRLGRSDLAIVVWESALEHLRDTAMPTDAEEKDFYQKNFDITQAEVLHHYYDTGKYRAVVDLADQILVHDPANLKAIQMRAFALTNLAADTTLTTAERAAVQGDAIAALKTLDSLGANDPTVTYFIGQFNLQRGDTAAAIASFEQFVGRVPDDREALFNLGLLYLEGGAFVDNGKARDTFEKLTELYPDEAAFWKNYGVALIRSNDPVNGKKAYEKGKALAGE
jgi:tetratricopeptide (TPR) repeat protein